jgi:hypothetical protein
MLAWCGGVSGQAAPVAVDTHATRPKRVPEALVRHKQLACCVVVLSGGAWRRTPWAARRGAMSTHQPRPPPPPTIGPEIK